MPGQLLYCTGLSIYLTLSAQALLAVLALVWVNLAACRAWAAAFAPELRGSASVTPVDERPFRCAYISGALRLH